MQKNNVETVDIDISSEVNEFLRYDTIVLFVPANDLIGGNLSTIEDFLYNDGSYGKNLVYILNSQSDDDFPNINSLFEKWGLYISSYTIYESDMESTEDNNPIYGWNEYLEYSFIRDINSIENPVIIPYARAIKTDSDIADEYNIQYEYLLQSKKTSYYSDIILTDENNTYGPFNTAITAVYNQLNAFGSAENGVKGKVMIMSDEKAFSSDIIASNSNNNKDYFLDLSLALLGQNDTRIEINSKSLNMKSVSISEGLTTAYFITFVVAIPIVMLILFLSAIIINKRIKRLERVSN